MHSNETGCFQSKKKLTFEISLKKYMHEKWQWLNINQLSLC